MPAYLVVENRIRDASIFDLYIRQIEPIVKKYGGRYLVREGKVSPLIGGWKPERMIILEFPSAEKGRQFGSSPEYRELIYLQEQGAEMKAVLLEGETE